MLDQQQLQQIKNLIENSTNPLFLFDNDPDGFCSATILLKNFEKGKAYPIKSFPNLDYNLKDFIENNNPDTIFVLDKPLNSKELLEFTKQKNINLVIIDHHESDYSLDPEKTTKVFSTFPSSEPTSFICQKLFNRKETEWIAMIGCIYDIFMPDFAEKFQQDYPELINLQEDISRIRYSTDIGKITHLVSLGLKSSNTTIQNLFQLFLNSSGPNSILIEDENNKYLHRKYNQLNKIIQKNVQKANIYKKFVFLEYSGEYSLSSDISNQLFFENPNKFIVVCYKKYDSINISIRGNGAKKFAEKIVKTVENSSGGGHELACGLRIPYNGFKQFKDIVFQEFH